MPNSLHSSNKDFAIVLAAGASTRMGTCKAGLSWLNGSTLLSYQVEQLLKANIIPVIVLGPHNAYQQQNLPANCQFVINLYPETGKVSSILAGLKQIPKDFHSLMIVAIDQPRSQFTYQTLLQAHQLFPAPITAPTYKERMGHPLIFSNFMHNHLEKLNEETFGLRYIVQKFKQQIHRVEFNTPDVLTDLNTPEQYLNAFSTLNQTDGKFAPHSAERQTNPEHCQRFQ
jgi:molybdenum cofactor cytidylyltransferase